MQIDGDRAFKATLGNKARRYPGRDDARYDDHLLFPAVTPSFALTRDSTVFTIGSCFARNVEEALVARGLSVPTARFAAPEAEAPGRPNRILNQYNPGTMVQCVRSAAGAGSGQAGLYPAAGGQVTDCLLATGSRPVSEPRAMERRAQIDRLYAEGLAQADCVVITLGLVEAWYDRTHDIYLNEAPPPATLRKPGTGLEFRRMGVPECHARIAELIDALRADRPRNIVLTVSPVPLQVTFAGGDATTANAYSKSVLRVVADMIVSDYPDTDYFPSYEMVTTAGFRAYGEDNVHVRPVVVDRVVSHMLSHYLTL